MPANLTPQYKEAEHRYRAAVGHEERLAALREMLAVMPKHKGTEKLQADRRHRIANWRRRARRRGAPAVTAQHAEPYMTNLMQGADGIVLVLDPTADDLESSVAALTSLLDRARAWPATQPIAGRPSPVQRPVVACATRRDLRVWGHARFDGQQVDRDHVLFDRRTISMSLRSSRPAFPPGLRAPTIRPQRA